LTLSEVATHFQAHGVPPHKVPKQLELVDDLPRTLAGKVQKYRLREALAARPE
jgi:non-ribosomal peptide synthetase component E (peptide arylation enzyme)